MKNEIGLFLTTTKKLGYIENPNDGYNPTKVVDDIIQKKTKQFFTDPNYQKKVINTFTENVVQENFKKPFYRAKVNLDMEYNAFIKTRHHSKTTNHNYKNWVNNFLNWASQNNIDPLKIKRVEVDAYIYFLSAKENKQFRIGLSRQVFVPQLILFFLFTTF